MLSFGGLILKKEEDTGGKTSLIAKAESSILFSF
jgi:hypothetical protein